MGRQGVPTNLKLLRGNPGQRRIYPEPQPLVPADVPEPPIHLGDDGRAEWSRVAPELLHLGLLTVVDFSALSAYCQAYDRWVVAERLLAEMAAADPKRRALLVKTQGGFGQNPLVRVAATAARDMMSFAAQFGLTPTARRHLAAKGDKPTAKFDGLT